MNNGYLFITGYDKQQSEIKVRDEIFSLSEREHNSCLSDENEKTT